jgi:transcriptional regulator with XRE-family HTH domain
MFNSLLIQYRTRANLSKTDLARRMDVTATYVMQLEAGTRKPPSLARLKDIVQILNINGQEAQEFINSGMLERITPEVREWIETYRH